MESRFGMWWLGVSIQEIEAASNNANECTVAESGMVGCAAGVYTLQLLSCSHPRTVAQLVQGALPLKARTYARLDMYDAQALYIPWKMTQACTKGQFRIFLVLLSQSSTLPSRCQTSDGCHCACQSGSFFGFVPRGRQCANVQ